MFANETKEKPNAAKYAELIYRFKGTKEVINLIFHPTDYDFMQQRIDALREHQIAIPTRQANGLIKDVWVITQESKVDYMKVKMH